MIPLCATCARYRGVVPDVGHACGAFPEGVPVEILSSRVDHRYALRGDGGLWYAEVGSRADSGKLSKASVGYVDEAADPTEMCSACVHVLRDVEGVACDLVEDGISAGGWCRRFAPDALHRRLQRRYDDDVVYAAGIMLVTPDRDVLLLRRTGVGDAEGEWSFPGGKLEDGETAEEAARRECREEIGHWPEGDLVEWTRRVRDGVDFTTFLQRVSEAFEPELSDEHDEYEWVPLDELTRQDKVFEESDHPRDEGGQFTDKGAVGGAAAAHLTHEPDRSKWPRHVRAMKIPPAWTDVRISLDPKAPLQAIGRDSKGRPQYVYSGRFKASRAADKFRRIKRLDRKLDQVKAQNDRSLRSHDPLRREHAAVTALIMDMGLRPGSERDTGGAERAFGATTLTADHVVTSDDRTSLRFVGKKGVKLDLHVTDPALAADLRERARVGGQLFPTVTDASLRRYVGKLDGGGFKTKDLRTLKGTRTAQDLIDAEPPPTSETAYKRAVKRVAVEVSRILGNTPSVALSAYISPLVFAPWREALSHAGHRQAA